MPPAFASCLPSFWIVGSAGLSFTDTKLPIRPNHATSRHLSDLSLLGKSTTQTVFHRFPAEA